MDKRTTALVAARLDARWTIGVQGKSESCASLTLACSTKVAISVEPCSSAAKARIQKQDLLRNLYFHVVARLVPLPTFQRCHRHLSLWRPCYDRLLLLLMLLAKTFINTYAPTTALSDSLPTMTKGLLQRSRHRTALLCMSCTGGRTTLLARCTRNLLIGRSMHNCTFSTPPCPQNFEMQRFPICAPTHFANCSICFSNQFSENIQKSQENRVRLRRLEILTQRIS